MRVWAISVKPNEPGTHRAHGISCALPSIWHCSRIGSSLEPARFTRLRSGGWRLRCSLRCLRRGCGRGLWRLRRYRALMPMRLPTGAAIPTTRATPTTGATPPILPPPATTEQTQAHKNQADTEQQREDTEATATPKAVFVTPAHAPPVVITPAHLPPTVMVATSVWLRLHRRLGLRLRRRLHCGSLHLRSRIAIRHDHHLSTAIAAP